MSAPELTGVLPVLATPFTADLDLDLGSLAKLTQWQVDAARAASPCSASPLRASP